MLFWWNLLSLAKPEVVKMHQNDDLGQCCLIILIRQMSLKTEMSSLMSLGVVVMTAYGATCVDKVGMTMSLIFQWLWFIWLILQYCFDPYSNVTWTSWPLKSSTSPLGFNRLFRRTPKKASMFRVTGHCCGESTGGRWIPLTKCQ